MASFLPFFEETIKKLGLRLSGAPPEAPLRAAHLGFLTFRLPQAEILMPAKKLCDQELTWEQHVVNQALIQRWRRIEHVRSSV
jgi:hypothetical protein